MNMGMHLAKWNVLIIAIEVFVMIVNGADNNNVFSPCSDTKVQKSDGFTFGLVFSSTKESFAFNKTYYSPCDRRLSLSSAQLAVFRPKVDEISLLTINRSSLAAENGFGFMVAFAGKKYAARSDPSFVANNSFIVPSTTLVLEFKKGTLQNLFWKRDGCASCSGKSSYVCLNGVDCALRVSDCGQFDCSISLQVAFSGTDKHLAVLNSWYEVKNLRQFSLFNLYSNLRNLLPS